MPKYDDLVGRAEWLMVMSGRAWVFGDHVRSAQMLADAHIAAPPDVARAFVMAGCDPTFAGRTTPGDFIVAGRDFGADATHRAIPLALQALGIAAVLARSFGRFFWHHAVSLGLPPLVVEETAAIKSGDRLRVDVETRVVANLSSGDRYVIRNIDDETLQALRAGGSGAPLNRSTPR